jgi:hypothetical protein
MAETPFDRGPYLLAALLCEKVLVEEGGVKSAIRIIDRTIRMAIGPSPPEEMAPFTQELFLLMLFRSGSARGAHTLEVRMTKPSGESRPALMQTTANFEGEDDRGVDFIIQMAVEIDQVGLYWFEVYLEKVRVTRVPYRVLYQRQFTQTGPGGERPPLGGGPQT